MDDEMTSTWPGQPQMGHSAIPFYGDNEAAHVFLTLRI